MEEGLGEIKTIAGVRDSFICDHQGEVIACAVSSGLDTNALRSICREVMLVMAALEITQEVVIELDFMYGKARMIVRNLANSVLIVLCEPQIDIAMLRLTLDVVASKFKADNKIQSRFAAGTVAKKLIEEDVDETTRHLLELLKKGRNHDA